MKNFKYFIFIVLIAFVSCKRETCETGPPYISLRFANYSDSSNYLFGSNKKYNIKQMKFYSLIQNDSLFILPTLQLNYVTNIIDDSLLNFTLNAAENKKIFIKYPNNKLDSIEISYYFSKCGTGVSRFWVNEVETYTGSFYNFYTIYK